MPKTRKATTYFPDCDDMLVRLKTVIDEPYYSEGFYPFILKYAGDRTNGMGVVVALALAVEDYCHDRQPIIRNLIYMTLHDFVDALIDDAEVRRDAHEALVKLGVALPIE